MCIIFMHSKLSDCVHCCHFVVDVEVIVAAVVVPVLVIAMIAIVIFICLKSKSFFRLSYSCVKANGPMQCCKQEHCMKLN